VSALPQVLEELHRLLAAAERNGVQSLVLLRRNQIDVLQNRIAYTAQADYFARLEALK
jgi:hypothetical protein